MIDGFVLHHEPFGKDDPIVASHHEFLDDFSVAKGFSGGDGSQVSQGRPQSAMEEA